MKRLIATISLLGLAAVLAACSGVSANPSSSAPAASGGPAGDAISLAAKDLKFSQSQVSVPAGKAFALVFDNQDGAPHNVAISDASGTGVFKGEIVSATQVTYQVPALTAGTYTFICEVHPDMKGTIVAD
jgi:plastocyanin